MNGDELNSRQAESATSLFVGSTEFFSPTPEEASKTTHTAAESPFKDAQGSWFLPCKDHTALQYDRNHPCRHSRLNPGSLEHRLEHSPFISEGFPGLHYLALCTLLQVLPPANPLLRFSFPLPRVIYLYIHTHPLQAQQMLCHLQEP